MFNQTNPLQTYAAVLGATGVALGAFGAHGLKGRLSDKLLENWKTAVLYQLLHAVALLGVPRKYKTAGQCMALGTVLFSGSIYCLCLEVGPKKVLGPTTPLGGLLMIAGWSLLGLS